MSVPTLYKVVFIKCGNVTLKLLQTHTTWVVVCLGLLLAPEQEMGLLLGNVVTHQLQ